MVGNMFEETGRTHTRLTIIYRVQFSARIAGSSCTKIIGMCGTAIGVLAVIRWWWRLVEVFVRRWVGRFERGWVYDRTKYGGCSDSGAAHVWGSGGQGWTDGWGQPGANCCWDGGDCGGALALASWLAYRWGVGLWGGLDLEWLF